MRHQTAAERPDAVPRLTSYGKELLCTAGVTPSCLAVAGEGQAKHPQYLAYSVPLPPQPGDGTRPWPLPTGRWESETFVVHEGLDQLRAEQMIGSERLFVAWVGAEDG